MTTLDDPCDRLYRNTQAYNYKKREETFVTSATREEALKNAKQLIESEKVAKLKAEQKEAKKKRQKEKKRAEKAQNGDENKKNMSNTSTSLSSIVTDDKVNKPENTEENNDEKYDECLDEEKNVDDEFLDINAAFVKVSVKPNKSNAAIKTAVQKPDKVSSSSNNMPMPVQKLAKPKKKTKNETPELLGIESCRLILNNDFGKAIEYLSEAILLAPKDIRHFLNRSYAYLRLGRYSLALSDAQFANSIAQSNEEIAKANARAGQALCGLQRYREAEKCFEKIMLSGQGSEWILRELLLTRVLQLTNMGFCKTDTLEALQHCSTVIDAVTLLTSGNYSSAELETKSEIEICNDDDIFVSDDESSNNTTLLSKLVSNVANASHYLNELQTQPSTSKAQRYCNSLERASQNSSSMESLSHINGIRTNGNTQGHHISNFKVVPSTSKTQTQKIIISDSSSIWVGSIEKNITDHKLRELFSKCGEINYIRRFPDKKFVFIDYKNKRAATKALNYPHAFEVNGIKLPVKPAPGTK